MSDSDRKIKDAGSILAMAMAVNMLFYSAVFAGIVALIFWGLA